MALVLDNLVSISAPGKVDSKTDPLKRLSGCPAMFAYYTADAISAVKAANYFDNAGHLLPVGTRISVYAGATITDGVVTAVASCKDLFVLTNARASVDAVYHLTTGDVS